MGFWLELKLLLWKNFTLKKRKPVMFIFELLIPLVLFIVLVLIRRRKPPSIYSSSYYSTWPLPSAGLIAVMQAFCDTPPSFDEYGFPKYPNSSVQEFLKYVNTVGENYNFFKPGFTLDELQEVPRIYRSIIEDPLMLKEFFEHDTTAVHFGTIFKDPISLQNFMTKNLSFDKDLTEELLFNATIERRSLFRLLFHNPNVSEIFYLPIIPPPTTTPNNESQNGSQMHLNETKFDVTGEGLMYSYLRSHDLTEDIFGAALGFKHGDWEEVAQYASTLITKIILNEEALSNYICNSNPNVILWSCRIAEFHCDTHFKKLSEVYCQLPVKARVQLLQVIGQHVDTEIPINTFKSWKREDVRERMQLFTKNVETFVKFKLSVGDLYKVSESMPQEYCADGVNITSTLGYEYMESETTPDIIDSSNSTLDASSKKKHGHPQPFVQIWKAMQKTICGADVIVNDDLSNFEDIPMTDSQKSKLKLLVHVLYTNPQVLYVPSGTAADKIIQEANRTFLFFDTVTNYASTLANVSEEIKSFLTLNATEYNLFIIRKIQKDMVNSPLRSWFISDHILRNFIQDNEIADKQIFINQLDVIGVAACSWKSLMRGLSFNIFKGFQTEDEMLDYFKTKAFTSNATVLAGVVFYMNDDGSLPNHMIYKIRQNASFVKNTLNIRSQLWFPGPGDDPSIYYELGFLWIQDVFERAMINLYSDREVLEPGSYIHHMPYPCYMHDQFLFMIQHVMALCLTVSWVYSVAMLVQHIVYEKEQRLKEVMKMMGMRNSIHWIAWFISAFTQMTITVTILTVILKYGKVLAYSNVWIIFLTMEIFAVSIIMFSFLVSVLFSKAKIAAACAGILYFMSYVPYLYIAVREEGAHETVSFGAKLASSFLAPTALGLAAKYFAFYEEIGQGIQWDNIAYYPEQNHSCNLAYLLIMLLWDAFVYLVLFWYIENVHPGAFGIPKPWNFPFTKAYWLGTPEEAISPSIKRHNFMSFLSGAWWNDPSPTPSLPKPPQVSSDLPREEETEEKDWQNMFEEEPEHLPRGVTISHLSKKYKNATKYAVQNLNLNLYEGQITALLGPTGSGKTTIMSVLTGLYPPTSGSADIYGNDIGKHMDTIRSSLGLCPQHNVLFDDLTVDEHIWFYSRLKQGNNDVDAETEKLIVDLDLPHKRNQKVNCLSGGMKRRLSVAIAFVGGSKVVCLDEATAGVDPVARRAIWDLILKYKKGRTILLSTHHMDEADILGDRIAIIENGSIKCCGSPSYLKHHLGDGYHLFIVKQTEESEILTSKCSQQAVTSFIKRRTPGVKFVNESKHELHYMLSLAELKEGHFVKLFRDLEEFKQDLHISSYGVKNTTLEEIFMKVISERLDSESDIWLADSNEQIEMRNGTEHDGGSAETIPMESFSGIQLNESSGNHNSFSIDDMDAGASELASQESDDVELGKKKKLNKSEENEEVPPEQEEQMDFLSMDAGRIEGIDDPSYIPKYPVWQQFCAIITKRYLCTKRNLEGLISQILLPSFFVSVAMSVALTAKDVTDLPELILSTSQFSQLNQPPENIIGLANNKLDLFEERMSDDAVSIDIEATFRLPSGPGASCVLKSPFILTKIKQEGDEPPTLKEEYFDTMCGSAFQGGIEFSSDNFQKFTNTVLPLELLKSSISKERNYPICYCGEEKTGFICPTYGFSNPESFKTVTGDIIYNISGQNESQYYLYTADKYRLRRYGGISLGVVRNHVSNGFGKEARSLFGKIAVRHAAKVWYDENGYHSVTTYLNVLNNAILRANLPKTKGSPAGYGITVINHPWPNTHSLVMSVSAKDILQGNEVLISIFIIVAMSFVPASFALFVVYERYTRSSHLQLLSGVHPMTYLTANYIWDVCNYFVPAFFIVAILLIFDVPAYSSKENLPAVIILFLMYGWCISPVMHCASLIFSEPSSAYIFLIVINLFVGITCIVTSFLLEVFNSDSFIVETHNVLKSIFLVFPNYCLGRGLMDLTFFHYYNQFLSRSGQEDLIRLPFSWEATGRSLSAMACTGLSFFVINFLIESRRFNRTRRYKQFLQTTAAVDNCDVSDEDVLHERGRVMRGLANNDILRVENLTKVYHTRRTGKHLAVDKLCFGVPPGECFGLLGVNSAGKSTTFKMLTGDTPITFGEAFINTHNVKTNGRLALKSIGYCPQIDALLEELTAREHLQLYARLRGVRRKEVDKVVDWALKKLDLLQVAERPCRTYSGGNRRKISTAIALIGSPSLIFLDEPTSGTDPRSRRFLWDLILSLVKEGRSIVFTSHSMEECEVLCTRLAIMVQGQFRCIGSTQHLKNKFGDGYSLTLRCSQEKDVGKIERYTKKMFPFAILKEKHHNSLHYEIASQHVSLDDIFQKMETASKDLPILDYSVSQNTLDNVFINFVKNHYQNAQRSVTIEPSVTLSDPEQAAGPTLSDTANVNV